MGKDFMYYNGNVLDLNDDSLSEEELPFMISRHNEYIRNEVFYTEEELGNEIKRLAELICKDNDDIFCICEAICAYSWILGNDSDNNGVTIYYC